MEAHVYEEMLQLENKHWWFIARRKIIADILARYITQKKLKILDAGCGNGDNLAMLSGFGAVTAMEKDTSAQKHALKRNVCQVLSGALPNDIPQSIDNDYDLIVLLDVLEHIDDDLSSLKKLNLMLNQQGLILITVPAYQFLWSSHDELHHHHRRYSRKKLQKLIINSGFEIEFISYFNCLLFPLALIDRIVKKLTKNNKMMALPPAWLNSTLRYIFSFESNLIGKIRLPFGLSLMAIARKNSNYT